jgi:hypothetical protein
MSWPNRVLAFALLAGGAPSLAAVRPTAARIAEVSELLPAQPAPLGAPATDRTAWAPLASRLPLSQILSEADRLAPVAPPAVTDDLYLTYSRTGSRTSYETVYNSRRDRLTTFAWAEALDGRGRYVAALQREVDAILDERAWTLPAHDANLDNFYGRVVEVDLGAAMRGWSLATVAGWFGADLAEARLTRLQAELRRRVVDPYLNALRNGPRGGFWWLHTTNNWNAVCHAGVVGTALAAVADRNVRAEVVAGAEANLPYFVSGFTDDGYCSEGIGYWSYGFGHHVLLAETVAMATGNRLRLLQGAKLERVNAFPAGMEITSRVYPAFSDNAPNVQPALWVAPLARRALDGGAAPARLPTPGWTEVARDQLYLSAVRVWTPSVVSAAAPPEPELRHWFDQAQVLVTRAATDFGAAIKGGHNDELHNHNDLGSFVIALGTTALIVDPGSEVYTARTFSDRRYESNVLNSYGHGVPVVAGRLQSTGRTFAARVLATDSSRERDRLLLNLKGAYEVPALLRLEREFVCRRGTAEGFTITDEFEFASPQNFGTALITFSNWRPIGSSAFEIGTGAERVFVRLESEGGAVAVRSEVIEEDLPAGRRPVRLGLEFAQPVVRGRILVHVTRAVPLLSAAPGGPGVTPARLHNLSTLGAVRGGEGSLLAGFTLAGPGRRHVLLRAVGPGLAPFGVAGALRNPVLILRSSAGEFARNDDWSGAAVANATAAAGAFPLAAGSADAALLVELTGGSYTAQVDEPGGGTGGVLAELYDAGGGDARLVNLSTRGHVPAGSPLTLGLSVGPGESRWFLLRGVGPALAQFGVANALPDPQLEVFSGGTRVGANDDWTASYWSAEVAQAARSVQAFPLPANSADAAVLVQLPPGNYTFQVSGKSGASGTALAEAYELP